MKLKNKKTGEIKEVTFQHRGANEPYQVAISDERQDELGQSQGWGYKTLAELNEEWEDYEESKEHWYITIDGDVRVEPENQYGEPNSMRLIGNYFETREEAEKAVEKLKAWQRLKDKGFRFEGSALDTNSSIISAFIRIPSNYEIEDVLKYEKDFQLLFGGEE